MRAFIGNSPLKVHKQSYTAYTEWGEYMRQLFEKKKAEVCAGESREGLDLMGKPPWRTPCPYTLTAPMF
jgi:hypothetical protein